MKNFLPLAIFVPAMLAACPLVAQTAPRQSAPALAGVWRADDGSSTVRVAQCPGATTWCATVIDERLEAGEPSMLNQTVVRDMRPNGNQRWAGSYIVDGQSMRATVRMPSANALAVRVCAMPLLCETIRLSRVRS